MTSSYDLDNHGQPTNRAFNAKRIQDRGVDELLGLCKGMIADGKVNEAEASFLLEWLDANQCVATSWPGNVLYPRIYDFLRDGVFDAQEQAELFDMLTKVTGTVHNRPDVSASCGLPFDVPAPKIVIENHSFCLTGRFAYGSRDQCAEEILNLGGWVHPTVLKSTHFVVVGTLASRDWAHSSYGRKIETALGWKQKGAETRIVAEDRWVESILQGV